jgi:hypothetical protein
MKVMRLGRRGTEEFEKRKNDEFRIRC